MALAVKNLPAKAGDTKDAGSIPVSERSPRVGNGDLPGKFHGQGSLEGYSLWGCKESVTIWVEGMQTHSTQYRRQVFASCF